MDQPPRFPDNRFPQHVYQLQRSLYGLKQVPRQCFFKLTNLDMSPDSIGIQDILRLLAKAFSMKDLGQAHFFLGIELLILQPVVFSLNLIISSQFFAAQKY